MTTLAIALVVTIVLLAITIGGNRNLAADNRRLTFELDDARNEVRWHQRRRHPAGRMRWLTDDLEALALREAMEDRDRGGAS